MVGYVVNEQVRGYLTFTFKGHNPDGFLWNDMVVPEFFWENTDALNQLLAFLHCQADQVSRVIFHTQDDNFHHLFFDPRSGIEEVVHPVAQQTNVSAAGIMYRITDAGKIFSDLSGHRFRGPDICLGLHIQDSFIPANNGTLTVAFKNGVAQAAADCSWDVQLSLDIAEFSSLLVGAVDVRTLLSLGPAQITDYAQADKVNEVFRAEKPICVIGFQLSFSLTGLKKIMYNIFRLEGDFMPKIRSSTDLRNNYNEISTFCHESREPVYITKSGKGDLAVMSIETYEMLSGKLELYRLLDEGRIAVGEGKTRPFEEVMRDIRQELGKRRIVHT